MSNCFMFVFRRMTWSGGDDSVCEHGFTVCGILWCWELYGNVWIVEEWKTNLMSFVILFHFLCAQHVSDINISIIRSLRLCCWITTSVVLFSVRCVLELWCGWFWVGLLMMDISMSETCWAHKKWNKIASDIKLVFHSSPVIFTLHVPLRCTN